MRNVTVEKIMSEGPCGDYCFSGTQDPDRARLLAVTGGRTSMSPLEVCALDIPDAHIVWVLTRPGVLPRQVCQAAIERIVERAVRTHALGSCIDAWARAWLDGTDRTEQAAAAAWAAAAAARAVRAAWAASDAAAAAAAEVAAVVWATSQEAEAEARDAERALQVQNFRAAIEAAIEQEE